MDSTDQLRVSLLVDSDSSLVDSESSLVDSDQLRDSPLVDSSKDRPAVLCGWGQPMQRVLAFEHLFVGQCD